MLSRRRRLYETRGPIKSCACWLFLMLIFSGCVVNTLRTKEPDRLRQFLIQPDELADVWDIDTYKEVTKFTTGTEFAKGSNMMAVEGRTDKEKYASEFKHQISEHLYPWWRRKPSDEGVVDSKIEIVGIENVRSSVNPELKSYSIRCEDSLNPGMRKCWFRASSGENFVSLFTLFDQELVTEADFAALVALASDKFVEMAP